MPRRLPELPLPVTRQGVSQACAYFSLPFHTHANSLLHRFPFSVSFLGNGCWAACPAANCHATILLAPCNCDPRRRPLIVAAHEGPRAVKPPRAQGPPRAAAPVGRGFGLPNKTAWRQQPLPHQASHQLGQEAPGAGAGPGAEQRAQHRPDDGAAPRQLCRPAAAGEGGGGGLGRGGRRERRAAAPPCTLHAARPAAPGVELGALVYAQPQRLSLHARRTGAAPGPASRPPGPTAMARWGALANSICQRPQGAGGRAGGRAGRPLGGLWVFKVSTHKLRRIALGSIMLQRWCRWVPPQGGRRMEGFGSGGGRGKGVKHLLSGWKRMVRGPGSWALGLGPGAAGAAAAAGCCSRCIGSSFSAMPPAPALFLRPPP